MTDVDTLLEEANTLYRDTRFSAVARFKSSGGLGAIGYLPIYMPREIIHAAGMLPVGITGHGDLEIIRGDAYFQSYICHLPRSVIEMGLSGAFDDLDGAIFPSTCDVIRNLSGMWKVLFPDKYSKYFDVPQNFDPHIGGRFYQHELQTLRQDMHNISGAPITDEGLWQSIILYNKNRQLVQALYDARREEPWLYPTSEVYVVVRAGHVLPVEEHNTMLTDYLELAKNRDLSPMDNIHVVVSGAFCEQPPLELLKTLEQAGCYVVDDDFMLAYRWFERDIEIPSFENTIPSPIAALADAFLNQSTTCASVFQADGKNGDALVEKVRLSNADGVVFAAPSFCDPALLDQPMNVAALDAANISYTAFKYAENTGQFHVIREQAGTFSDSIRLWEQT